MEMKKAVVLLVCVVMICFLQCGRDIKVNSSMRTSGEDGSEEYLNITANKIFIFNKDEIVQEIIEKRIENSFQEIYFIEEYPNAIEADVYSNWLMRKLGHRDFSVVYEYDGADGYSYKFQ